MPLDCSMMALAGGAPTYLEPRSCSTTPTRFKSLPARRLPQTRVSEAWMRSYVSFQKVQISASIRLAIGTILTRMLGHRTGTSVHGSATSSLGLVVLNHANKFSSLCAREGLRRSCQIQFRARAASSGRENRHRERRIRGLGQRRTSCWAEIAEPGLDKT